MAENVRLVSARRAYEFGPDDIRLTVLSMPAVTQHIQRAFGFQSAVIGTPQDTFGSVPLTIPGGVVCNFGMWPSEDGQTITPIRFLHFEPRRVVIDVAGQTSAIDQIYASLATMLAQFHAPDGSPALGQPQAVYDYSEIAARFPFSLEAAIAPGVRDVWSNLMRLEDDLPSAVIVPQFSLQIQLHDEEYAGMVPSSRRFMQLALRAGTKPGDQTYYSAAPCGTTAHLAYLENLEALLK